MQDYLNGKCSYFQVNHTWYSQPNQLVKLMINQSEVLEMKSIHSSSSANSSPAVQLDELEKERTEQEVRESQDESTKIDEDGKGDVEKMETLLIQIKYQEEQERPVPEKKKQQVTIDVNLLEKSETMSEQLECVESIRVEIAKPIIDYCKFFETGILSNLEESKSRVILEEKPEKVKEKRSCYMACQRANAHSVSSAKKEKEIKHQQAKIQELVPKNNIISLLQEERVIEENGKSGSKRQKKEFIMACQRVNLKPEQPKKKKEKEVNNKKKKKDINEEKPVFDPNALQANPEFQEYFERCKLQPCGKLCRGGNPITMICAEKNCDFEAEHCTSHQCLLCSSSHQNCFLKFTYEMFTKSLQKNVMRQKKTMQIVYSTYDNIIKEINKNREKTMKFLCVQGVNEALLKDLEARYQEKQHISFKGKEVLTAIEMLGAQYGNNLSRESKILEKMKQDEKMILERLQREMHLLFEPYTTCSMNVLDSRLITNKGQAKYVLEQLNYPKDMKLLYRASEHEFSIKKFHQTCDKEDNTFTIIKTEFGKLIGGFTPLKWNNKYGRDRSNRTFMLAINLKEKLEHINHGESAIYYSDNLGPSFGGLFETKDIEIFEQNGVLSCSTSFPNTYNWKKFFVSSQQSWRFLTGVQNGQICRVMDYEVYKVYFREEKQQ